MRARSFARSAIACVMLCAAVGCASPRVSSFPAPDFDCLTYDDVYEIAERFPVVEGDPAETNRRMQMLLNLADTAAYCQTAAEKLL